MTDEGSGETGKPYKQGNIRDDGSYAVGRGRPPVATRFAVDDGRPRGRRPKRTRNFDTEFAEEAARQVSISENGKTRKVSKARAAIIRLLDNGYSKGQNPALDQLMQQGRRFADKATQSRPGVAMDDQEIIDRHLRDRAELLGIDPALLGDPYPDGQAGTGEELSVDPADGSDDE